MKKRTKKVIALSIAMMLVLAMVAGCSGEAGDNGESKGEVKLAYVNWAEGVAMTHLAQAILEDKMEYEVELTMADAGPIFTSLANGTYDAFLDGWLPITHEDYMKEYGDDLLDLGYNYENARIGLVVPAYVDIESIEELNDNKDKFDGKIVGIDAGAGIMSGAERAIEDYALDFDLMAGSGPTMTAALKKAIDNEEAVVVTGWKPHWKFARWDLKFLEDPEGSFGDVENIHTIARKDLKEDMPEVAAFLENFKMNDQELGSLMGDITESEEEPLDVAKKWMEENEELVNSWLPEK